MKKRTRGESAPLPEEILLEIKKQMKILAADLAIRNIEKLASTDERKAVWALCSGRLTREELAKKSRVHLNTVKSFVDIAMTYGLLEEEKGKGGHPTRVIDYVPSEWKDKIKKETVKSEDTKSESQPATS
jgi:hypothetical protein